MRFHADLHVHSKYSRATSRDLDLEHLAYWACRKGIAVVGTGDFTHPQWRAELKEKLVPAEPGLFRLHEDIEREIARTLPAACQARARFMLSVEISTIYKKGDQTRKIHHLLYAPDFETAEHIAARLARIGNIASDGRPILGLDSRDLLEITLGASRDAYLVPAHIWTPWFAVLGSQSGFDSIVDCYGDLAHHVFAVETGLSSDPPMNWRLSLLDRYRLVSNSDAHSPAKLGRETTLFDGELDYFAIRKALETGQGYVGTVEFFPEEGKYHLDGHRKCGARLTPQETLANGGRCPVCGQPATIGVLHRVEALADRSEAETVPPPTAGEASNFVPLPEVLSEISASGPSSKTVARRYDRLISALGPELWILSSAPIEDIARTESSLLAEAISRMRAGKVIREAGYDGEYGVIRLFEEAELRRLTAGGILFDAPSIKQKQSAQGDSTQSGASVAAPAGYQQPRIPNIPPTLTLPLKEGGDALVKTSKFPLPLEGGGRGGGDPRTDKSEYEQRIKPQEQPQELREPAQTFLPLGVLAHLDEDQCAAAEAIQGPLLIMAGPGSGKTRTLTHRIAHLVAECGVPPSACLAITFTRRAASEMRERLSSLLPISSESVPIHTFHSLGLAILREHAGAAGLHRGFRIASEMERAAALAEALELSERKAEILLRAISKAKRTQGPTSAEAAEAMAAYQHALALRNWIDFDDLIALAVNALAADPALAAHYRNRFRWISVDEFQDVDELQYRLLTLLAPPNANICVIGDPNQAIYGFRGADASCFERFKQDYPEAAVVSLKRNYRSTGTIVTASSQVIATSRQELAEVVRDIHERITIHTAPTERAEAEHVVHAIERMIGGHSFFSIDSGRATDPVQSNLGFADFAVLYRTDAQSAALCEAFARSGIPFKRNSHEPLAEQLAVRALLQELACPRPGSEDGGIDNAVGNETLPAKLEAAARRLKDRDEALDAAVIETALQRLIALAGTSAPESARFADAVSLATEADFWDPRADRVSLLTLHAAKGLEFSVVFIVGLEDGILPLHWSAPDEATRAEERRLFYVGMTRAKDRLILSRALKRRWRGRVRSLSPSPFLGDIESELVKHQRMQAAARARAEDKQLKLF